MRRLYLAVFGSGLGHATRIVDMAQRLGGKGVDFRYSSSAQGYRYLKSRLPDGDVVECPHLDVEWTEDGSFHSRGFVVHFPLMLRSFTSQVDFEMRSLRRFRPTVVVSDSRLSAVLAARLTSFPVVTILNQFKVTLPPRYRGGALGTLFERIAGDVLGLMWSASEQVLLTDLPPPYTIGEANVQGTDLTRIVRYVGFTTPRMEPSEERLNKAKAVLEFDSRPLIFIQISGPDATKRKFAEVALMSAGALSRDYKVVVSLGKLDGSAEPRRLAGGTLIYDWCPIKDELFMLSEVMVARAGHRTIGQCIDSGKPAVLVPIHNHSEQLGNAEKFQRLGLGISILPQDLDPGVLARAVDTCARDPVYRQRLEKVGLVSRRYNGLDKCVEVISSYG